MASIGSGGSNRVVLGFVGLHQETQYLQLVTLRREAFGVQINQRRNLFKRAPIVGLGVNGEWVECP